MHIPDGFLNAGTWGSLWVVSSGAVGVAVRRARGRKDDGYIPLLGVTAAFIFAAQMVNFPVGGGTSGHFMGGVLAAILLGPMSGLLVMTTVVFVQCVVFQDGGLTALGANIFNMGVVGAVGGYYLFTGLRALMARMGKGIAIPAFVAAWASIVLAAACCALELSFSGVVPSRIALPAMAGVHAVIGLGEGFITVVALGFIARTRPDLLGIPKA